MSESRFKQRLRNQRAVWEINSGAKSRAIYTFQGVFMHKNFILTKRDVCIMLTGSWWRACQSCITAAVCCILKVIASKCFPAQMSYPKSHSEKQRNNVSSPFHTQMVSVSLFYKNYKSVQKTLKKSLANCVATRKEVAWNHSSQWRPVPWASQQKTEIQALFKVSKKISIWERESGREQKETEGKTEKKSHI